MAPGGLACHDADDHVCEDIIHDRGNDYNKLVLRNSDLRWKNSVRSLFLSTLDLDPEEKTAGHLDLNVEFKSNNGQIAIGRFMHLCPGEWDVAFLPFTVACSERPGPEFVPKR